MGKSLMNPHTKNREMISKQSFVSWAFQWEVSNSHNLWDWVFLTFDPIWSPNKVNDYYKEHPTKIKGRDWLVTWNHTKQRKGARGAPTLAVSPKLIAPRRSSCEIRCRLLGTGTPRRPHTTILSLWRPWDKQTGWSRRLRLPNSCCYIISYFTPRLCNIVLLFFAICAVLLRFLL